LQQQIEGDERKLGTILLDQGKAKPAAVNEALQAQAPKRSIADSAIPGRRRLLDTLPEHGRELVPGRNQLSPRRAGDRRRDARAQRPAARHDHQ
jgi:two-component system chemotaxis sensor kinase CheA